MSTRKYRPASHPRQPLYKLVDTLARQGWGALAGPKNRGVQRILRALCSLLPYGSASGKATVEQIAEAAQYSMRWTHTCLYTLEDIGLITWQRGGVRYGRPVPSVFTVSKALLCELIAGARQQRDAKILANKKAMEARLAKVRQANFLMRRRKPDTQPARPAQPARAATPARRADAQPHVAVSAYPSPPRREDRRDSSLQQGSSASTPPTKPSANGMAKARAVLASLGITVPKHAHTTLSTVIRQ